MTSEPTLIERQMADVELRPFTLDEFHRRRHQKAHHRRITTGVMGVLLLAVVAGGVIRMLADDDQSVDASVLGGLESPFAGTWTSTDVDGSSQTMVIEQVDGDEHGMVIQDDDASVCFGAPSTMAGRGQVRTLTELVIDAQITCDDGTEPAINDADTELLANLRFIHDPDTDELVDNIGVLWTREGAPDLIVQGPSPFVGTWVVGQAGQYFPDTLEIRLVGDDDLHEVTMLKAETPQCGGGASTMSGTGRREVERPVDDGLVRLAVVVDLVCDDGSAPVAQAEQEVGSFDDLAITWVHDPVTDQLVGSLGSLFVREGAQLAQGDPMATIDGFVDAVNTADADALVDLVAPDGAFAPRGYFVASVTPGGRGISATEQAGAWMAINDAWGFEAEVISCTPDPEAADGGPATDGWMSCDVTSRWPKLSLEIVERWEFGLRGERLVYWQASPIDLDPSERALPLGFLGLEEWETWLAEQHPEDAARWLNPSADPAAGLSPEARVASEARDTWTIDGLEFRPTGLVPYDPAFADAIDASIRDFIEEG